MPTDVYLYDAVRTAFGKYGGALAGVRPDDLANDPRYFGFAPVEAANAALKRAGIGWGDVDAVELNEAFMQPHRGCWLRPRTSGGPG